MPSYPASLMSARRARDGRYDLLSAIDHLLEGLQLYSKAAQDARERGDLESAELFRNLERTSRLQAEVARALLAREASPTPVPFSQPAPLQLAR